MRTVLRLVSVFALFCFSVSAGQEQKASRTTPATAAEFKMPPEAAKAPNPVKPTAASLAAGKKTYGVRLRDVPWKKMATEKAIWRRDMKLKMLDYRAIRN